MDDWHLFLTQHWMCHLKWETQPIVQQQLMCLRAYELQLQEKGGLNCISNWWEFLLWFPLWKDPVTTGASDQLSEHTGSWDERKRLEKLPVPTRPVSLQSRNQIYGSKGSSTLTVKQSADSPDTPNLVTWLFPQHTFHWALWNTESLLAEMHMCFSKRTHPRKQRLHQNGFYQGSGVSPPWAVQLFCTTRGRPSGLVHVLQTPPVLLRPKLSIVMRCWDSYREHRSAFLTSRLSLRRPSLGIGGAACDGDCLLTWSAAHGLDSGQNGPHPQTSSTVWVGTWLRPHIPLQCI